MKTVQIRPANVRDTEKLLSIYAYYVRSTAITFEYEVPTPEEFQGRIVSIMEKYPYLVLEADGEILGYAYSRAFVGRAAYRHSSEVTIYVDHNARGLGYGRKLYEELENRLKEAGILNLYACIGDPVEEDEYLTRNSEQFHRHMGFSKVGTFHQCGYKFGRWYNMIWMEKIIGPHR